jgi:hypothetical protein
MKRPARALLAFGIALGMTAVVWTRQQTPRDEQPAEAVASEVEAKRDSAKSVVSSSPNQVRAEEPKAGSPLIGRAIDGGDVSPAPRCEIIDGIPDRPEVGDLDVVIDSPTRVVGVLTVSYTRRLIPDGGTFFEGQIEDGGGFFFAGEFEDYEFDSTLSVTQSRVTVRNCSPLSDNDKLLPGGISIQMNDGRGSYAAWPNDGGRLRLKPVHPTKVRGHLKFDGGSVPHAWLFLRGFHADEADGGHFEFQFLADEGGESELTASEPLTEGALRLVGEPIPVRYSAGATIELGELAMTYVPYLPEGLVGIGWADSDGPSVVDYLIEKGPAERAGIKVGDLVVEVDGFAIATIPEAMKRIPGAPGTKVRLKIRRGAEYLLYDIVRRKAG